MFGGIRSEILEAVVDEKNFGVREEMTEPPVHSSCNVSPGHGVDNFRWDSLECLGLHLSVMPPYFCVTPLHLSVILPDEGSVEVNVGKEIGFGDSLELALENVRIS